MDRATIWAAYWALAALGELTPSLPGACDELYTLLVPEERAAPNRTKRSASGHLRLVAAEGEQA